MGVVRVQRLCQLNEKGCASPGDWRPREAGSACEFDGSSTGSNGSTPRMEPGREPLRGSAQRDNVLISEELAGDPAHAARRMVATGKCLRLCW